METIGLFILLLLGFIGLCCIIFFLKLGAALFNSILDGSNGCCSGGCGCLIMIIFGILLLFSSLI